MARMPFTLMVASGRVTPVTVMLPTAPTVLFSGEVTRSFRPALMVKGAGIDGGSGVLVAGLGVAGIAVAGGGVRGTDVAGISVGICVGTSMETGETGAAVDVTVESPPQAAAKTSRAAIAEIIDRGTTGKTPILTHHRPNTCMTFSWYGPSRFTNFRLVR